MLNKIKRGLKKAVIKSIRSRQIRASEELATYLIRYNSDFRGYAHSDLAKAIASKKPVSWAEISH